MICGDLEGFQKLSKVSGDLRKSAKFTASQKKETEVDFIDSVGELVRVCEKEGFIPRFYVPEEDQSDVIDKIIRDMKNYTHKLVTEDLGFGQQIENTLKKIEQEAQMEQQEDELWAEDEVISNEDYEAYFEDHNDQLNLDQEVLEEAE